MSRISSKQRRCRRCLGRPLLSKCAHSKQQPNKQSAPTVSTSPLLDTEDAPVALAQGSPAETPVACHAQPENIVVVFPVHPVDSASGDVQELPVDNLSTSRKRARVSQQNPLYGKVEGAMRGNQAWVFPRTKPLRPVEQTSALATNRFNREIANIISRCERLSHETGCWLFIGAQHALANKPFVHFSSERIRRDAPQELTEIASKFSVLCGALVASRRTDARKLAQKLAEAEQQKAVAETELEAQRHLLSEKDAMIAHYEALLSA